MKVLKIRVLCMLNLKLRCWSKRLGDIYIGVALYLALYVCFHECMYAFMSVRTVSVSMLMFMFRVNYGQKVVS